MRFSKSVKIAAPASLHRAVAAMQSAYDHGDWNALRAVVPNRKTAGALISAMTDWKSRNISSLDVSLVYAAKLKKYRYVGTVRFSADARAAPTFSILRFDTHGKVAHVVRTDSGIRGQSFTQADWEVTRTQHFIVYHSPYQLLGADRQYLVDLEREHRLFAKRFKVKLPAMASVYVYPSRVDMSRLTKGGCGGRPGEVGCTLPFDDPPMIQTTIAAFYHEPIHVYERALEPQPQSRVDYVAPLFIGEGLAVALEDRDLDPRLSDYCSDLDYAPLDDCARLAVQDVDPMKLLSDTGFKQSDAGDAYALGGSFVKYLILKYGYYRFGRFYYRLAAQPKDTERDYDVASKRVYGRPIRPLISAWKGALCFSGC